MAHLHEAHEPEFVLSAIRLVNPFLIQDRVPPEPAVRLALVNEYIRREIPMNLTSQGSGLLLILIGLQMRSWAIVVVGIIRILVDNTSRIFLRRVARDLAQGRSVEKLLRWGGPLYAVIGASWAVVALPAFLLPFTSAGMLILPAIAVVAMFSMATSSCFVPRLFTATTVGFTAVLIPFWLNLGGTTGLVLVAAAPLLQFLLWDLARNNLRHYTDMLEMQVERDRAIAKQVTVIDELHASRQHARDLAATDTVTGLPNRQAFLDHLDLLVSLSDSEFTLILVDLDYFKNINDTLGHHVGDAVLVGFAQVLQAFHAPEQPFAARLGGDEFALVVPGALASADLHHAHEGWLKRLAQLPVTGIGDLFISATCGSARYPMDGCDRRTLLNVADMALRAAKSARRGTLMSFQPQMLAVFNTETRVANLLARSIDEGSFAIHMHPQVSMADGTVVAAEALGRFTDAELARFPVQTVFDVAEERGLGQRLSATLLRMTGAAVLDMQPRMHRRVPVAINLSPSTLKTPEVLLQQLREWISQGLSPSMVKLEITEDAIAGRGLDHVQDTLGAIASMGFELALDDFGTGQASLAHLHSLPIHEVKIAKEFVEGVCTQRKDQAIVKSAVTMCEYMGIRCVIEGVETEEQSRQLQMLGARFAQGYLWSRPMTIDAFLAHIRERGTVADLGTVAAATDLRPQAAD